MKTLHTSNVSRSLLGNELKEEEIQKRKPNNSPKLLLLFVSSFWILFRLLIGPFFPSCNLGRWVVSTKNSIYTHSNCDLRIAVENENKKSIQLIGNDSIFLLLFFFFSFFCNICGHFIFHIHMYSFTLLTIYYTLIFLGWLFLVRCSMFEAIYISFLFTLDGWAILVDLNIIYVLLSISHNNLNGVRLRLIYLTMDIQT